MRVKTAAFYALAALTAREIVAQAAIAAPVPPDKPDTDDVLTEAAKTIPDAVIPSVTEPESLASERLVLASSTATVEPNLAIAPESTPADWTETIALWDSLDSAESGTTSQDSLHLSDLDAPASTAQERRANHAPTAIAPNTSGIEHSTPDIDPTDSSITETVAVAPTPVSITYPTSDNSTADLLDPLTDLPSPPATVPSEFGIAAVPDLADGAGHPTEPLIWDAHDSLMDSSMIVADVNYQLFEGELISDRTLDDSNPPSGVLPSTPAIAVPDPTLVDEIQTELRTLEDNITLTPFDRSAPSMTIVNPSGFGVDNGTFFVGSTFQSRTRYSDDAEDGAAVIGVGLGDAREAVGVELSYTVASFGTNRNFGSGGFNLRVHRRFSEDFSASIGWNGFLLFGVEDEDFEDSIYGVATKIFDLNDDLNDPFSRLAVTVGVGNGQFRLEDDVDDDDETFNAFGTLALRIAEPVSFITEWSGQDLGLGFSIAPFRDFNLTITPAVRDITGAGDGARFVLGVGATF